MYESAWRHPILTGEVEVKDGRIWWAVNHGPVPLEISSIGDCELVTYAGELAYHGSADALLAAGIDRKYLPLGKCGNAGDSYWQKPQRGWRTRRQLDGTYVHWIETEAACLQRAKRERESYAAYCRKSGDGIQRMTESSEPKRSLRPSHLRLVIDNDRPQA